jgi:hypothetical protein
MHADIEIINQITSNPSYKPQSVCELKIEMYTLFDSLLEGNKNMLRQYDFLFTCYSCYAHSLSCISSINYHYLYDVISASPYSDPF